MRSPANTHTVARFLLVRLLFWAILFGSALSAPTMAFAPASFAPASGHPASSGHGEPDGDSGIDAVGRPCDHREFGDQGKPCGYDNRGEHDDPGGRGEQVVVQAGDDLSSIAAKHGVPGGWWALYGINRDTITDPNLIRPGLTLRLP